MHFDEMNATQRRLHNAACVIETEGDEHGFAKLQRDAIAEIEALRTVLRSFTNSRYIRHQHPRRFAAAVEALGRVDA